MTKLKNGAKGGVFIVPSNSAIFGDFRKFCFMRNIGAFWKFWFARNYLCPPMGYLLSPPTWRFLEIFGRFGLRVIICALRWGIYCPLQLGNFLEIFGSFVSRVIFLPFVSAILEICEGFCLAHNYLCPPILWSQLCSSCCSSSICLLFYP